MSSPLISVVMSVYNGEKYLDEAVQSILDQTFPDFEFIIINDGSTDATLEMLEKYKAKDNRIVLVSRENKGLVASLNEGISLAKGKYIARMDADDISFPERFFEQCRLMEFKQLDICGCHYEVINAESKKIDFCLTPLGMTTLRLYLLLSVPFAHGSVMIRRGFLEEKNLVYGTFWKNAEDKGLWIEMYRNGARFDNVDQVLFRYREFNMSLSKRNKNKLASDVKRMRANFIKEELDFLIEDVSLLANDIEKLSYREVELLSDTIFLIILKAGNLKLIKYIPLIPARFKVISFFKLFK